MEIIKRQIAYNRSKRTQKPVYIVIHDTGNKGAGADAEAHFKYFNACSRSSSADFFVDDTRILQVNDYTEYYTWHCGDGKGKYGITNHNSVGIEICVNSDGDYDKAVENAVELARYLTEQLNIPLERVVRHYDASRKNCPASMSKNNWALWDEFKNKLSESEDLTMTRYEELKNEIHDLTETIKLLATELHDIKTPMIYNYIDENMPQWAHEAVKWAVDTGIVKGDGDGLDLDDKDLRFITILYRLNGGEGR